MKGISEEKLFIIVIGIALVCLVVGMTISETAGKLASKHCVSCEAELDN